MSRPKGSKNKPKNIIEELLVPVVQAVSNLENESVPHGGQFTKCCKCDTEMIFFVQPKLTEKELKNAICGRCKS